DEGSQGVPLVEYAELMSGQLAADGVPLVEGARRGRVQHPVAEHPEPPAEIDILEEGEIVLVEASARQKHVPPRRHRSAAREEQRLDRRGIVFADRPAVERLKAMPVEVDRPADEIDGLPVPAKNA